MSASVIESKQLRPVAVEHEQAGADEEEHRGDGHVEQRRDPHAFGGFAVVAGRDVALHVALVDGEIAEVRHQAEDEHDPERRLVRATGRSCRG